MQLTQVALRSVPTAKKKCLKWPPKQTIGHIRLSYVRWQTVPEPRCCRSKCSVAKRALCATDDQCSSVGRTQSSDTGVGDDSAVVSQVAWDVAGQRPMNQRGDLVVDALPHWKPVQLAKHRWDVIASSHASDQPGRHVLHWLRTSLLLTKQLNIV